MTKSLAIAILIILVPGTALAHGPWISPIGVTSAPEATVESPAHGPWISPIGARPVPESFPPLDLAR